MKILHPLNLPGDFQPRVTRTKPRFKQHNFYSSIQYLQREVSKLKLKNARLSTNYALYQNGKAIRDFSRSESFSPSPIVQFEFTLNCKDYTWIVDKYFRAADNIYALSIALKNWKAFTDQKIFVTKNHC